MTAVRGIFHGTHLRVSVHFGDRMHSNASIHDYYEALAGTYDENRFGHSYGRYLDTQERCILRAWLGGNLDRRVDLGCGTGRLLEFAGTGVDGSAAMLDEARKKYPGRELRHADIVFTGFPEGSFEAALCFHVLMHLEESKVRALMAEAARILEPRGLLIVDIPSAPRRRLGRRPPSGWHGDLSASLEDLVRWAGPGWRLRRWRGILFFPIHRLPSPFRNCLRGLDALIGRTPLARWSSYYVCELERL